MTSTMNGIKRSLLGTFIIMLVLAGCSKNTITDPQEEVQIRSASADYSEQVQFKTSASSATGKVYEVLPGPAVMNPMMNPTPFSDNLAMTTGSYSFTVKDITADDSENSEDAVVSVDIRFTGNNGQQYKIDQIQAIRKPAGSGDHTFYGGVGRNKMMHGDTEIGTNLMPKMLAYITLWGVADLKDAETDTVLAAGRVVHIMTATRVRDMNLNMIASAQDDMSDQDFNKAETHVILPPLDMQGNMSPVPGTAFGFLHMMFEEVELSQPNRDYTLAYEILPGPAVINPAMSPTPFSNRIALGAGSFSLEVKDVTDDDSEDSEDTVESFDLEFQSLDGTSYKVDNVQAMHKPEGAGDHTFYGGVGFDKQMHGNTGIGTPLMPQLKSYITLWGVADLKDGEGNVLAQNRPIHVMVSSRVRTDDLKLISATDTDQSDDSSDKVEAHIIFPPTDLQGNMSPIPGTKFGFLHLMFEKVQLQK